MSDLPVFPDGSQLSIEDRLALLEARTGIAAPLAVVPPITIGSLTNVPVPGSQIAAQWAQDVSSIALHRFANLATIGGWAAPNGAHAIAVDTGVEYRRIGGVWSQVTPWMGSNAGVALNGQNPGTASTLNIPADLGVRTALVSCVLKIDCFTFNKVVVQLRVDGGVLAESVIPANNIVPPGGNVNVDWNVGMSATVVLAANAAHAVTVVVIPDAGSTGSGIYHTLATVQHNRVDAVVTPRGY